MQGWASSRQELVLLSSVCIPRNAGKGEAVIASFCPAGLTFTAFVLRRLLGAVDKPGMPSFKFLLISTKHIKCSRRGKILSSDIMKFFQSNSLINQLCLTQWNFMYLWLN